MHFVLCGKCVNTFKDDRLVVNPFPSGFKRDKCQGCGRVKWTGQYNVQVKVKNPNRTEPATAV